MKILSAQQIREADKQTIQNEPISSIDLMERAVSKLFESIDASYSDDSSFAIFCGKGNNGGDGLALARWLFQNDYFVQVFIIEHSDSASEDFKENYKRLSDLEVGVLHISAAAEIPEMDDDTVLIDAMLGSGLSRPLEGLLADVVKALNTFENEKLAIDIPTGLFADDNSENSLDVIFKADVTLTFQCPKLSMVHKDTANFVGQIEVLDINLDEAVIERTSSLYSYLTPDQVADLYKPREKFSYKGTYGHALLIAGSYGSLGAALMSGKACLRSGAGLLTAFIPKCGVEIYQSALPEAMVISSDNEEVISGLPDLEKYNAVGVGPGLGTSSEASKTLGNLLEAFDGKMVLDADALNILAANPDFVNKLSTHAILTPHPGEFKRLLGLQELKPDYLERLKEFSKKHSIIVVLKDAITAIAAPDGQIYFMDYGTPALAKGGSGDVLTGIITGLLASGYDPLHAAQLGVYLQGIAAHFASDETSEEACLATDVIHNLGKAFRTLS
ncbi:NAD(P)H-hydrate dehydratase [Owenweeksia hongkongensis]|uniref:NAD(P)H-hydrate dehydratase n=1 Tax=Owenweeksia hongkongensis TaxID=253245 RepID=UPI003A934209